MIRNLLSQLTGLYHLTGDTLTFYAVLKRR
jgi:hypothetical protein